MDGSVCSQNNGGSGEPNWEVKSLTSLRNFVQSKDSKTNLKSVPKMTQLYFISLWKAVYDIFQTLSDDQVSQQLELFTDQILAVDLLIFNPTLINKLFQFLFLF